MPGVGRLRWALLTSGMLFDMLPKDVISGIAPQAIFIIGGDFDTTEVAAPIPQ